MSFETSVLESLLRDSPTIARVVIAEIQGSSPREVGAAMWVYGDGQSGTIGGGAMEFAAIAHAKALLKGHGSRVQRFVLGPDLGQCCGGVVVLLYEVFDARCLEDLKQKSYFVRKLEQETTASADQVAELPLVSAPLLSKGWFIERIDSPKRFVWLYGAGHVGRAVVHYLAPISNIAVTWVDIDPSRFPDEYPDNVRILPAQKPADAVRYAPKTAEHFVMTHSHSLDFETCHAVLSQEFFSLGLIGSKTKAARFRSRLKGLGHDSATVSRMVSPIGKKELGKEPYAIAIGIVHRLLLPSAM